MILQLLPQILVSGLTAGSVYALVALGFHLVYATTRVLNFAYGTMVILGSLFAYSLMTSAKLSVGIALPLIVLAGLLVGLCFQRLAARPIESGNMAQQILGMVVAASVIETAYALIWGKDVLPVPAFSAAQPISIMGASLQAQVLWVIGVCAACFILVSFLLNETLLGRALRATAANRLGARVVGIRPAHVTLYSYLISTVLAMLAGAVISPIVFAGGFQAMAITVKGFTASIFGGLSSVIGALVGGLIIGLLEAGLAAGVSSGFREAIMMGFLLLVLLVRPEGLFGGKGNHAERKAGNAS